MSKDKFKGKDLKDLGYEDLMKLNRKQLMELFFKLDAPSMSEMRGEYHAALLDSGYIINMFLAKFYLHFTWGDWQHKAFEPLDQHHGHGYNTFITTQSRLYENYFAASVTKIVSIVCSLFRLNNPQRLARIMLNKTSIVSSVFDARPSFQLSYRDYNTFYTNTMTDEVRKVNDNLFLGIGRLTVTFGKFNPMPFVLIGPPDPWVGPDIEYKDR
ncbi:MAG: hypothetical protein CVU55_00055 [Deltaproteobacteria bacterium HGW-Deltaproteobacteria-13]|jgi:hypothetical protein|nr:MAG: hypothetical protein CVU55_00055 [Deltaproteobacteria bacterium HGW-Deltaproteobacteria-13]